MTNIEFKAPKDGGKFYTAEFATYDSTALHILREDNGGFVVEQSSIDDGNYAVVEAYAAGKVIDVELMANVYPKYWRVKSESKVVSAVTTEGE